MSRKNQPTLRTGRPLEASAAVTPTERLQAARRLLDLTREMLALGRTGDWALFAEREEERQWLSRDLFATPVPRAAAPLVADCIRRVLDLDQELTALAEAQRDNAARAVREAQRGRRAADLYRRFSR
ncbi:MAG: flagellar protein FliT [Nitrococcus sp.]|nr:flagellar protein FliT [Nitrococcus sp.]